jgi:vitamin B12 transporter
MCGTAGAQPVEAPREKPDLRRATLGLPQETPPEPERTLPVAQVGPKEETPDLPTLPPTRVVGTPFPAGPSLPSDVGVTPTRTETPLREFGGSVSVIDQAKIVNSGQPFLRNVLQTTPGLDVIQNGGPGRVATVFLRGQSSRATKVLVDGIPINDPSSPQRTFDFGALNTLEIERVEVLRGPQSTLYGSDAVGGVINVITKRGQGPMQGWVSSMGGSYGTFENVAHVSGGNDQGYYSFGASEFETRGFSVANRRYGRPFNTENDPYRQNTLSTRFGWTPHEDFDVDVVLRYLRGTAALDSFNQAPFDLITDDRLTSSRNEQFYGRVAARLALLDGDLENRVAYNRFNINRDFSDPNSFFPPTLSVFHGGTDKFEYQGNLKLTKDNRFTFGLDHQLEEFDNPPSDPLRKTQSNTAFYLQDQFGLWDRWFTTAGIRWDEYERAGPATTWRVASVFRVDETGSALHGSYGTGFIAPSLFELFANAPPFILGNRNLRPEHARGFEYGFEQSFLDKNLIFDVTYFRIDSEDLIQYVFPTYQNVSQARASGVELITTVKLTRNTSLVANYTNTNTLDVDRDRDLQLRPQHKGSLTLNHLFLDGRANWNLQLLAVGERFDYSAPVALQRMAPYAVVNTALWYDLRRNVRLFARVDNLFDTDYEELVGYGTARFSAYAGVKITFGGSDER